MHSFLRNMLLFTLIAVPLGSCTERKQLPAIPGNPAPAFAVKDLAGNVVRLDDLKGAVVVLDFWATWCGPCAKAVGELEELHRKYSGKNVVVIGISVNKESDAAVKVQEFVSKHRLSYRIAIDDGSAYKAYGVTRIPATFVIDKERIIRDTYPGFLPGIGDQITATVEKLR